MMLAWISWVVAGAIGFAVGCLALAWFISRCYRPDDDEDPRL